MSLRVDPEGADEWYTADRVAFTALNPGPTCLECELGFKVDDDGTLIGSEYDVQGAESRYSNSGTGEASSSGNGTRLVFCGNAMAVLRNDGIRIYDFDTVSSETSYTFKARTEPEEVGGKLELDDGEEPRLVETNAAGTQWWFTGDEEGDEDDPGQLVSISPADAGQVERTYNGSGQLTLETTLTGDGYQQEVSYTYDGDRVSSMQTTLDDGQTEEPVRYVAYTTPFKLSTLATRPAQSPRFSRFSTVSCSFRLASKSLARLPRVARRAIVVGAESRKNVKTGGFGLPSFPILRRLTEKH